MVDFLGSEGPVVPLGLMHHRDCRKCRLAMPSLLRDARKYHKRLDVEQRSACRAPALNRERVFAEIW